MNEEELSRFVIALFEDPRSYKKSVRLGPLEIVFRLPSFADVQEMKRMINEAIINKQVRTKSEVIDLRNLLKMAVTIDSISYSGKFIFENKNEPLHIRRDILYGLMKTDGQFHILKQLCKQFHKHYNQLMKHVVSKDFF
jgi:hypothetical protein